ncbi:MAG: DUF1848 domain-containing protein [Desulfovibrio sp.]|jgi:DNA repair photolyase|nr:DUF1848 domain-containing protein [Desulfovibrio sp.]
MAKWPVVEAQTDRGREKGIAPCIVSASRATDIPAFHGEWFMRRLGDGYTRWKNPFNNATTLVSFQNCKLIVFWTKNPAPFLRHIDALEKAGQAFYFQFTLNNYEREMLEPGLPGLEERLQTFERLSDMLGRERVIWRYDPIILGKSLPVEAVVERMEAIGDRLKNHTEKLVFSFVDMYRKTAVRLRKLDSSLHAPGPDETLAIAEGVSKLAKGWGNRLVPATCAEEADLSSFGIARNSCIDGEFILRLRGSDPEIRKICRCVGEEPLDAGICRQGVAARDRGQRKACRCAPAKDIGAYNTCRHFCEYCYANGSRAASLTCSAQHAMEKP